MRRAQSQDDRFTAEQDRIDIPLAALRRKRTIIPILLLTLVSACSFYALTLGYSGVVTAMDHMVSNAQLKAYFFEVQLREIVPAKAIIPVIHIGSCWLIGVLFRRR